MPGLLEILLLNQLVKWALSVNIVNNPGFDNYSLNGNIYGEEYSFLPSNMSLWYNQNGGLFQVKNKHYPAVGQAAQLSVLSSYVLCQNIVLEVGAIYNLKFDMVSSWSMSSSTVMASIGNQWIMNLSLYDELSITSGNKNFTAKSVYSSICFDSVFQIDNFLIYAFFGPYVDNVTIEKVQNAPSTNSTADANNNITINSSNTLSTNGSLNTTNSSWTGHTNQTNQTNTNTDPISSNSSSNTSNSNSNSSNISQPRNQQQVYEIYCHSNSTNAEDYWQQQLVYICNYQNSEVQFAISFAAKDLQIYCENELQNNFQITNIQPHSMQIHIMPNRNYYMPKISFIIGTYDVAGLTALYKFYINGATVNFLDGNSSKMMSSVYTAYRIASNTMIFMQKAYTFLKASFFSFFLADIICFWNLSLMYNLLKISTVPQFSKYFLQKLTFLFFNLNSFVKWMTQKIPNLQLALDFSTTAGTQQMINFKNGYAWFGSFGMSSGFMKNNIQQILTLLVLVIKIAFIKFLIKLFICKKIQKTLFSRNICFMSLFLDQILPLQIFMVISAGTDILQSAFISFKEKLNNILQINFLWLIIMLFPLYFIIKIPVTKNQILQQTKQQMEQNYQNVLQIKYKKSTWIRSYNSIVKNYLKIRNKLNRRRKNVGRISIATVIVQMLYYMPYFFIPMIILFNSPSAFLATNTILIVLRCFYFYKKRSLIQFTPIQKLFQFLNIFVWVIHHFTYVLFWILQLIINSKIIIKQKRPQGIFQAIKVCGLITVFSVLLGGVIEIIHFILQILIFVVKIIKKCLQKCQNHKQIKQSKPQQKLVINRLKSVIRHKVLKSQVKAQIIKENEKKVTIEKGLTKNQDKLEERQNKKKDKQELMRTKKHLMLIFSSVRSSKKK